MTRRRFLRALTYLFLFTGSAVMLCPVLYLVLGAFTTPERYLEAGLLPVPNTLNLPLLARAWAAVRGAYLVTLLRVGFYVLITVVVGVLGGYTFSRLRFPGRQQLFLMFLAGLILPNTLLILPQYILIARFPLAGGNDLWGQGGHGFAGAWPALFLYGWVPPFAIFLLKQTFDMLPGDYEDAARLDGAGTLTLLIHIYGPLLRPALAAVIVVTFLSVWNDYLWPSLTIAGNPAWYPVSFQLANLTGDHGSPGVFMRLLMGLWPPALVYFVLQRYLVQGLVASGLKG